MEIDLVSIHISICIHSCHLQPLGARGSLPIKPLLDLDGGALQQAGRISGLVYLLTMLVKVQYRMAEGTVPQRHQHAPCCLSAAMLNQLGPPRETEEEKEPHISGRELLFGVHCGT